MTTILSWLATNALLATVLAGIAALAGLCRCRPAVLHALWLLVLLKLVTPPLVRLPTPAWSSPSESTTAPASVGAMSAEEGDFAGPYVAPSEPQVSLPSATPAPSEPFAGGLPPAMYPAPGMGMQFAPYAPVDQFAPLPEPSLPPAGMMGAPPYLPAAPDPWLAPEISHAPAPAEPVVQSAPPPSPLTGMAAPVEPVAAERAQSGFSLSEAAVWLLPALFVLWAAGALLWWGAALLRMTRFCLALRAAQPAGDDVQRRVQAWATQLGLRRAPPALVLNACVPPLLWSGCFRPRLLLPDPLWSNLSTEQQDSVLVHELAHLRRGDHLVRWLELFALGAYWWLPVAWQARRELQRTEELCCDAWVVWALPAVGQAYARALLDTAAFVAAERVLLPAGASGMRPLTFLKRRIAMVLQAETPRGLTLRGKVLWGALAAAFLPLGFVLGQGQLQQPAAVPPGAATSAFAQQEYDALVQDVLTRDDVLVDPNPTTTENPAIVDLPAPPQADGSTGLSAPVAPEEPNSGAPQQFDGFQVAVDQQQPTGMMSGTMPGGMPGMMGGAMAGGMSPAPTVQQLQRRLLELDVTEAKEDLDAIERLRERAVQLIQDGVQPVEDIEELNFKARRAAGRYERAQIQLQLFDLQWQGAYATVRVPVEPIYSEDSNPTNDPMNLTPPSWHGPPAGASSGMAAPQPPPAPPVAGQQGFIAPPGQYLPPNLQPAPVQPSVIEDRSQFPAGSSDASLPSPNAPVPFSPSVTVPAPAQRPLAASDAAQLFEELHAAETALTAARAHLAQALTLSRDEAELEQCRTAEFQAIARWRAARERWDHLVQVYAGPAVQDGALTIQSNNEIDLSLLQTMLQQTAKMLAEREVRAREQRDEAVRQYLQGQVPVETLQEYERLYQKCVADVRTFRLWQRQSLQELTAAEGEEEELVPSESAPPLSQPDPEDVPSQTTETPLDEPVAPPAPQDQAVPEPAADGSVPGGVFSFELTPAAVVEESGVDFEIPALGPR